MSRAGLSRRPVGNCAPLLALFFHGGILGGERTEARSGGWIADGMRDLETSLCFGSKFR
jgi:hypothetical protein